MKRFFIGLYENILLRILALVLTLILGVLTLTLGPVVLIALGTLVYGVGLFILALLMIVAVAYFLFRIFVTILQPIEHTKKEVLFLIGIKPKPVDLTPKPEPEVTVEAADVLHAVEAEIEAIVAESRR